MERMMARWNGEGPEGTERLEGTENWRPPEPNLAPSPLHAPLRNFILAASLDQMERSETRWNGMRSKVTERDLMEGRGTTFLEPRGTTFPHRPVPSLFTLSRPSPSYPVQSLSTRPVLLHAVPSLSTYVIPSLSMLYRPSPPRLVPLRPVPSLSTPSRPCTPSSPSLSCPVPLHPFPSLSMPSRPSLPVPSLSILSRPSPPRPIALLPVPSFSMPPHPFPSSPSPLRPVPSLSVTSHPPLANASVFTAKRFSREILTDTAIFVSSYKCTFTIPNTLAQPAAQQAPVSEQLLR